MPQFLHPETGALRGHSSQGIININETIHVTHFTQCLAHNKYTIKLSVIAFAMGISKKGMGVSLVGAEAMEAEGRVLQRSPETHFFMSSFKHESVGSPRQEFVSALLIWKFWCQKQCFVHSYCSTSS